MHFEPENVKRYVWDVCDRVEFFESMRQILNIKDHDAEEIKIQLQMRDFDYLEIAAHMPGSLSDDPDAVLVFDGKKDVYWDLINIEKTKELLNEINKLAPEAAKMTYQRGLTQRDWRKRLEALSTL